MAIRVGINGFGRIGRMILRSLAEDQPNKIQVVAMLPVTFLKDEISSHIQPFFQDNDGPLN
jgi:glyceraldehyde-3-phosphate dehydrogenase/erythrose-4-phosphate dehydrogenase